MSGTARKEHGADWLRAIRLRYCINTWLEDRGLVTPAQIGVAVGLPAAEAVRLLTNRQWSPAGTAAPGSALSSTERPIVSGVSASDPGRSAKFSSSAAT